MKTTYTPGPWKARPLGFTDGPHVPGCYAVEHEGTRQWVASQVTPRDAALIAAAPDLLAALESLFEHCAMVHKHWGDGCNRRQADEAQTAALAAIARAKGEA